MLDWINNMLCKTMNELYHPSSYYNFFYLKMRINFILSRMNQTCRYCNYGYLFVSVRFISINEYDFVIVELLLYLENVKRMLITLCAI